MSTPNQTTAEEIYSEAMEDEKSFRKSLLNAVNEYVIANNNNSVKEKISELKGTTDKESEDLREKIRNIESMFGAINIHTLKLKQSSKLIEKFIEYLETKKIVLPDPIHPFKLKASTDLLKTQISFTESKDPNKLFSTICENTKTLIKSIEKLSQSEMELEHGKLLQSQATKHIYMLKKMKDNYQKTTNDNTSQNLSETLAKLIKSQGPKRKISDISNLPEPTLKEPVLKGTGTNPDEVPPTIEQESPEETAGKNEVVVEKKRPAPTKRPPPDIPKSIHVVSEEPHYTYLTNETLKSWLKENGFEPSGKKRFNLLAIIEALFTKHKTPRILLLEKANQAYENKDFKKLQKHLKQLGFKTNLEQTESGHELQRSLGETTSTLSTPEIKETTAPEPPPDSNAKDFKLLQACREVLSTENTFQEMLGLNIDNMAIALLETDDNVKNNEAYQDQIKACQKGYKIFTKKRARAARATVDEFLDESSPKELHTELEAIITAIKKGVTDDGTVIYDATPDEIKTLKERPINTTAFKRLIQTNKAVKNSFGIVLKSFKKPSFALYLKKEREEEHVKTLLNKIKNDGKFQDRLRMYTDLKEQLDPMEFPAVEKPQQPHAKEFLANNHNQLISQLCRSLNTIFQKAKPNFMKTILSQPDLIKLSRELGIDSFKEPGFTGATDLAILPFQRLLRYNILLESIIKKSKELNRTAKKEVVSLESFEFLNKTLKASQKLTQETGILKGLITDINTPIRELFSVIKNDPLFSHNIKTEAEQQAKFLNNPAKIFEFSDSYSNMNFDEAKNALSFEKYTMASIASIHIKNYIETNLGNLNSEKWKEFIEKITDENDTSKADNLRKYETQLRSLLIIINSLTEKSPGIFDEYIVNELTTTIADLDKFNSDLKEARGLTASAKATANLIDSMRDDGIIKSDEYPKITLENLKYSHEEKITVQVQKQNDAFFKICGAISKHLKNHQINEDSNTTEIKKDLSTYQNYKRQLTDLLKKAEHLKEKYPDQIPDEIIEKIKSTIRQTGEHIKKLRVTIGIKNLDSLLTTDHLDACKKDSNGIPVPESSYLTYLHILKQHDVFLSEEMVKKITGNKKLSGKIVKEIVGAIAKQNAKNLAKILKRHGFESDDLESAAEKIKKSYYYKQLPEPIKKALGEKEPATIGTTSEPTKTYRIFHKTTPTMHKIENLRRTMEDIKDYENIRPILIELNLGEDNADQIINELKKPSPPPLPPRRSRLSTSKNKPSRVQVPPPPSPSRKPPPPPLPTRKSDPPSP